MYFTFVYTIFEGKRLNCMIINRGSYMSANVLLIKQVGENDNMRGFAEHLIGSPQRV